MYNESSFPMKEFEPLGSWGEEDCYKETSRTSDMTPRTIRSWPHLQPPTLTVMHTTLHAPLPSRPGGLCHPEAALLSSAPGQECLPPIGKVHPSCKTSLACVLWSSPRSLCECLKTPLPRRLAGLWRARESQPCLLEVRSQTWGEDEENVFSTPTPGDCREPPGASWLFIYAVNKTGKALS